MQPSDLVASSSSSPDRGTDAPLELPIRCRASPIPAEMPNDRFGDDPALRCTWMRWCRHDASGSTVNGLPALVRITRKWR